MSSSVTSTGVQGQSGAQATTSNAYDKLDTNAFLKMLVSELQNQDPMNPMDNAQILQQVSQIKAIQSNDKLTSTLSGLQIQQGLLTASTLLQKSITGLTDNGTKVSGVVDKVSADANGAKVSVGEQTISLKNITEINQK